jgi:hypothetical protein
MNGKTEITEITIYIRGGHLTKRCCPHVKLKEEGHESSKSKSRKTGR